MRSFMAVVLCLSLPIYATAQDCMQYVHVNAADDYRITVDSSTPLRKLTPAFFGFNLEWLQFQLGFWDDKKQQVDSKIIEKLQDFSGAIYRYPGGASANYFNWKDGIDAHEKRPAKQLEDWIPPTRVAFGPQDYLLFIQAVKGVPWYVLNLYGEKEKAWSASTVANSNQQLAAYLNQSSTLPAIYRWELGNELDRAEVRWKPSQITATAMQTAKQVRAEQPQAKFVIALQEYPALKSAGLDTAGYNTAIVANTAALVNEYAIHLYYDDKPKGITVERHMRAVCEAINHAASKGVNQPAIWVTEHGFIPKGAWESANWKDLWPQTADMKAAMNVADFQIAAANMPNIQGTMLHALHGTGGPWPLFQRNPKGGWDDSVTLQALRLLRTHMLPNLLKTSTYSKHLSNYNGGYDMRAAVMSNDATSEFAIWAINRSDAPINLQVQLSKKDSQLVKNSQLVKVQQSVLASASPSANHYGSVSSKQSQFQQQTDANGNIELPLPAYSINAFSIQ